MSKHTMHLSRCGTRSLLSAVTVLFALIGLPTGESFTPIPPKTSLQRASCWSTLKQPKAWDLPQRPSVEQPITSTASKRKSHRLSTSLAVAINPLVVSAVGHVIGGNLATPFVIDAVKTWYAKIPLPSWTPPNGVFAPTWILLYSSLGVAVARVAAASTKGWKSLAVGLWGLHYLLNLTWAPLFFGMAKLRAGLVVNYLMVASLPFLFTMFGAVDRTASLLLLPYSAWLIFATILNHAICKLNPMDGAGYSNAMFEADLANLQKEAAKNAGL